MAQPPRPFASTRQGDAFVLTGAIDESAKLGALLEGAGPKLVLDLGGITFINSIGVREWVRLQSAAVAAGVELELRRVAEVLIHQLNIVPAARAASKITSFYASYLCDHCDEQQMVLLDVETHRAELEALKPPPVMCKACGKYSTFADAPELYLSFLSPGSSPLR